MYLLYCDETNLNPNEREFFIYGGIAVPGDVSRSLSDEIEKIRSEFGISPDFHLKFNPRPSNLSHQQFIDVKQRIIRTTVSLGCQLLVSTISHSIATSPEDARRNEINRVLYHFHCFLIRLNDHGLVLVDRFSDSQIDSHLREKFSIGIEGFPYTNPMRLKSIIGFHYSAIGQSHFPSIVDIVLGSLRFAVNAHARNDESRLNAARQLLELIAPLFMRNECSNKVDEISLFFSPKIIRVERYRKQYQLLKNFLADHGIDAQQEVIDPE